MKTPAIAAERTQLRMNTALWAPALAAVCNSTGGAAPGAGRDAQADTVMTHASADFTVPFQNLIHQMYAAPGGPKYR